MLTHNAANRVIRTHWEIENRVHWVLDVAMGEVNILYNTERRKR